MAGQGTDPNRGPQVALRRARPEDAEAVWALRQEPSSRRFQPLPPLPLEAVRRKLAERAAHRLAPDLAGDVQWLILAEGEVAGWLTLDVTSREHGLAAVGYTVGERFRGCGIATAGLRALLPLAFGRDGAALARLEAVAAIDNAASRRVLERAGFRFEGIARGYLVIAGERVDHARYGLLREEWWAAADPDRAPLPLPAAMLR